MKIAVYTIAKNEEEFVERWSKSSIDADVRVVLDTGSTDKTVDLLKKENITVHHAIIEPWRFDVARNMNLDLIPEDVDICISMDMDEILCDNWRKFLEEAWTTETTMLRYPFYCQPRSSYGFKVHSRKGYVWKYAVHEILVPIKPHIESWSNQFTMQHLPKDNTGSYLKALEFWHNREPNETHYTFYLAREYFDSRNYLFSLKYLEDYLNSKNLKDPNEESFVHRMIAWCLKYLGSNINEMIKQLFIAVGLTPDCRELWGHISEEMMELKNYPNAFAAAINAFRINSVTSSYMVENNWDTKISDLLLNSSSALGISQEKLKELLESKNKLEVI